jgi:hypothetical protein
VTEAEYHWQDTSGQQRGPSTWTEYKAAFESGETGLDKLVYAAGITDEWTAVRNVSSLAEHVPTKPKAETAFPMSQALVESLLCKSDESGGPATSV